MAKERKQSAQFVCGLSREVKFPECGYLCEITNPIKYCGGCGRDFRVTRRGDAMFSERINPLWKIQEAGGIGIRSESE